MTEFLATRKIELKATINGTELEPFVGDPGAVGENLLEQVADQAVLEKTPSPSVNIKLIEPPEFVSLTDADLQRIAGSNRGTIFLAVQLGLTDYDILERHGYKIPGI